MKKSLLISFIFVFLFFMSKFAPAFADTVVVNNLSNLIIFTEYQCKLTSDVDCIVDKIKYIQTGGLFYDAECNATHMVRTKFENDAIKDVESNSFNFCSKKSRTVKFDNN